MNEKILWNEGAELYRTGKSVTDSDHFFPFGDDSEEYKAVMKGYKDEMHYWENHIDSTN